MATYVIYRGSWRRGGDSQERSSELGSTSLYEPKTKMMCCLGQCAFEAGTPISKLVDIGEPADVDVCPNLIESGLISEDDWGSTRQSKFSNEAIAINDDEAITDQQREEKLIDLSSRYGHTITFVDGIAPWFAEGGLL